MLVRHHSKKGTAQTTYFQEYAESKLNKLSKLAFNVSKVDIMTYKEGNFYSVEICALGVKEIRATGTTDDLMESLDRAIDKIIKQVTKLKLASHGNRRERRKSKRENRHSVMRKEGFIGMDVLEKVA